MLTVQAEVINLVIGPEERVHKLGLFLVGNVKLAMFVQQDPVTEHWAQDKLPVECEDPVFLTELMLDLADMGYVLETTMSTLQ